METYVMIIVMFIAQMSRSDSGAVETQEFSSKESCEKALSELKKMDKNQTFKLHAVCVKK